MKTKAKVRAKTKARSRSKGKAAPLRAVEDQVSREPGARDPRTPPVGTVIQKKDRHGNVRCEVKVVEGGWEHKGTVYSSISASAMAAARDLGLKAKAFNGWLFWNLEEPKRAE